MICIITNPVSKLQIISKPRKNGKEKCKWYDISVYPLWPITCVFRDLYNFAKVVNSNPVHGEVYSIQHYVIKFVIDLWQVWFSLGTPVSFTNKTYPHDITEILLKVAFSIINQITIFVTHL
jgi:hypothetical protein